jgi:hypothetical protein
MAAEDIMWIDDAQMPQRPTALRTLERRLRGRPTADRVKRWRLRKPRPVRSWRGAAPMLGSSDR